MTVKMPKAGDVLVAKASDSICLTEGKEYLVYETQAGVWSIPSGVMVHEIMCDGFCGDSRHYLTEEWEKHFSLRSAP